MPYLGLLKNTFIDYPGKIACAVFLPGCNFSCAYCHNHELITVPASDAKAIAAGLVTMDDFRAFLGKRKNVLEAVVVSGGEPFLSPDLSDVVSAARQAGLLVKVDTNGTSPHTIAETDADYFALDVKTLPGKYFLLAPALPDAGRLVLEAMEALRGSGKPYEFRITCAHEVILPSDFPALASLFRPGESVFLQNARTEHSMCDVTPFSEAELALAAATIASSGAIVAVR